MKTSKKSTKRFFSATVKNSIWDHSKWFKKTEDWGNANLIKKELLEKLNELRSIIMVPIIVTSGTQGEHTQRSAHYDGYAADIVIPDLDIHPVDFLLLIEKLGFQGIGFYPNWKYNGKVVGGWHLDMNPSRRANWLGVIEKGRFVYKPMNYKNLADIGFFKPST